ncbi:MAG: S9 family peptidase [Candidatus Latescibacteria bacterium]|nr:S9 family peptidase [Candidatus Latescibacterota bacterium]
MSKKHVASKKHPLTPEEVVAIKGVSDPRLSPDGKRVVFVVSEPVMEEEESRVKQNLWMVPTERGKSRRFTHAPKKDTAPRWSPDGKIVAFLSDREGDKAQVWLIPLDGGEAEQLTKTKGGVEHFQWAPDGRWIAFVSPDPETREQEQRRKAKDDAVVVDQDDFKPHHLWVIGVRGKRPKRLTEGAFSVSDPQWSPDGKRIALVVSPSPRAEDTMEHTRIQVLDVQSRAMHVLIPEGRMACAPRWSPNGRRIAFLADAQGEGLPRMDLFTIPSEGGVEKNLTEAFDRSEGTPIWSPDGRTIFFEAVDGVRRLLFSVPSDGGPVRPLIEGDRVITEADLAADGGAFVFLSTDAISPPDVWWMRADGSRMRQLTKIHPQIAEVVLGETGVVRWPSSDGLEIEGMLIQPAGPGPHPMIVEPHGGPRGARTMAFNAMWNYWVGAGYAVYAPNFRGSDGYGTQFAQANVADWGQGDYADIMAGVDTLVTLGVADPDRLAVSGWSYGGYMTNWIIGHTDRFKAAISGAGLSNLASMYGLSDIHRFMERYLAGAPYDREEVYRKHAPITYVKNITTPTLFLHGEADKRVPLAQGEELYFALKFHGVETQLVVVPREGHSIEEPRHRIDLIKRMRGWIDGHLGRREDGESGKVGK